MKTPTPKHTPIHTLILSVCIGVCLLAQSHLVFSQTRYVTDDMMISMRSGPGNEFRIINSRIKTGTKLTLIDAPQGDWSKVRTANGSEGWIRKQYVQTQPVAKILLEAAQNQRVVAEKKATEAKQQLAELQQKHTNLLGASQNTKAAHVQLSTEYQNLKILSEDAVNLSQRYQNLLAEHEILMTKHDALTAENDRLRSDQTISHGLYAIALLLGGMLIAILLPLFKPQKRYADQIL